MANKTIRIFNACRIRYFEYFYMVVMVAYAARLTPGTGRMVGILSGNPIPFLIPIFLTVVLAARNRINWHKLQLAFTVGIFMFWSFLSLIKYNAFGNSADLSYHFFLLYAIVIAFIHVQVYGKNMLPVYEHIMTWVCAVSLPLWILNMLFYNSEVPSFLEKTSLGYNLFYIYNWLSPVGVANDTSAITLRNSGCAWEPGLFATMICLAIYSNLSRNGVTLKKNTSVIWLLLALVSTQSTTGYLVCFLLYFIFAFSKLNLRKIFLLIFVLAPLGFFVARLDFMTDKIINQADIESNMKHNFDSFEYAQTTTPTGEYLGSLGRFESLYFDWQNTLSDPILGYSRNPKYSYFYNNISTNFNLTAGLAKIPAQYGIPYGLLIFVLLAISSSSLAEDSTHKRRLALFLMFVLLSISYLLWCVPIFTAFWLYGIFREKKSPRRIQPVQGKRPETT